MGDELRASTAPSNSVARSRDSGARVTPNLTMHDFQRMGVLVFKSARTMQRWWLGERVSSSTAAAGKQAVQQLGYPPPPHAR